MFLFTFSARRRCTLAPVRSIEQPASAKRKQLRIIKVMTRALILSTVAVAFLATPMFAQEKPSYAKHVRPFLAKYCLECHNAKTAKLGLNLEIGRAHV